MSEEELVQEVKVINERGIHTRMATSIAKVAKLYLSNIELSNGSSSADAKSVIALLTLAAKKGTTLQLKVKGVDRIEAFENIRSMIEGGFPGVED